MDDKRPRSQFTTASQLGEGSKGVSRLFAGPRAVILCALLFGMALFGACGQGDDEGPAPEPGLTSTATALPAVVTYTPVPPTATNPPLPVPTETSPATPTPTVAATDEAPAAGATDSGSTDAMAPPASDAQVTVLGEMNIRGGPGTDYEVIGDAVAGEAFAITGKNEEGNWWQIDFRGEPGWIFAPYVVAADAEDVPVVGMAMAETPVPDEETTETSPPTEDAIVTVDGDLNVRSGPGEEYDRIGGATAGEEFVITGKSEDGEWWQIDFDDQTGWIYAPFATAANAENVPIVRDSMTETPAPADTTEPVAPEAGSPVVTMIGDMNVREGPGTDYARIGGAAEGETFAITGKSGDGEWWQISFDGESGWVYAPFVTAANAENVPTVGGSAAQSPEEAVATVGGDLNVRDGPGTDYARIGGANEGEAFAITGKSADGEWWQIDFDGESGWIYAPFVNATNAENVPVVAPPSTQGAQGSASPESDRRTAILGRTGGDALVVEFEEG